MLLYDLTPFCLGTANFVYNTSNYLNMIWHGARSYEKNLGKLPRSSWTFLLNCFEERYSHHVRKAFFTPQLLCMRVANRAQYIVVITHNQDWVGWKLGTWGTCFTAEKPTFFEFFIEIMKSKKTFIHCFPHPDFSETWNTSRLRKNSCCFRGFLHFFFKISRGVFLQLRPCAQESFSRALQF